MVIRVVRLEEVRYDSVHVDVHRGQLYQCDKNTFTACDTELNLKNQVTVCTNGVSEHDGIT